MGNLLSPTLLTIVVVLVPSVSSSAPSSSSSSVIGRRASMILNGAALMEAPVTSMKKDFNKDMNSTETHSQLDKAMTAQAVPSDTWGHEDDTNVLYRCNWHFPEPLCELLQQPDFFTSQLCNVHVTGPQLTRAYYEWVHDDTRWIGTFTDMVTQSQIIVVNNVGPSYITNRNNFLNTYGNRMVNAIAKYDTDDDKN